MHFMTTNDEILYDKYDEFIPDRRNMKNMTCRDKNIHQKVEFGILRQPFELGKELEHKEEDKCHRRY